MAQGNIITGYRGKLGGMVLTTWRGKSVVRAYQPHVRQPNTPAQLAARARFACMNRVAAAMACILDVSLAYRKRGTTLSARNIFLRINAPLFVSAPDGTPSVDLAALDITGADGLIPGIEAATAAWDAAAGRLLLALTPSDDPGALPYDNVCCGVLNATRMQSIVSPLGYRRTLSPDSPVALGLPADWHPAAEHLLAFVFCLGAQHERHQDRPSRAIVVGIDAH